MDGNGSLRKMVFTALFVFCGVGGGALGFKRAKAEFRRLGVVAEFKILGGIELDPSTAADFERLTGAPCLVADVATLTPERLREFFGDEAPDVVFFSPPCKQACGLLAKAIAYSPKYVKMGALAGDWVELQFKAWPKGPRLVLMENVPRILSRAPEVVAKVRATLKAHGYLIFDDAHDLGELGGLAQHRDRLLLVGRRKDVPSLLYQPTKKRVRSIGEVLGQLPMPGDPKAGPLHRLPAIEAITALRLALIPAGKDWKALPSRVLLPPELAAAVAQSTRKRGGPRANRTPFNDVYRVVRFDDPAPCVTAGATPSAGGLSIADPRFGRATHARNDDHGVLGWAETAHTITGETRPSNGRFSVADPRAGYEHEPRGDDHGVIGWDDSSGTVTGRTRPSNGRFSVADPRPAKECHPCTYGVVPWDGSSHTITGNTVPGGGPFSVADPRLTCTPRENAGAYGVLPWSKHAWTVTAHACHDNGWFSAADPRALVELAKRVPFPLIFAEDGTWHRPLTTLECAVLQGFDAVDVEGAPFTLDGGSDKVRVKIGDAVPPPAAEAIARQMLYTLVDAAMGSFSLSSGGAVWVRERELLRAEGTVLQ